MRTSATLLRLRNLLSAIAIVLPWVIICPAAGHNQCHSFGLVGEPYSYCVADCDRNGSIEVSELVYAVGIATLGEGLATCGAADSDLDGQVSINELVQGVGSALRGCELPEPHLNHELSLRVTRGCAECNNVQLRIATLARVLCRDYRLSTAVRIEQPSIVVVLGCVIPSKNGCVQGPDPHTAEVGLDLPDGAYNLEFHSRTAVDRYLLRVDGGEPSLEEVEASFTEME